MNALYAIDVATFKRWLTEKQIRPASMYDVLGTQHDRPCFKHPNTGVPYVSLPDTEASRYTQP
jgi:hypothetical protein